MRIKARPDAPQHYEDIHYRNITLTGGGPLFEVRSWTQYSDLQGEPSPKSVVKNVTVTDIKGSCESLGEIAGKPKTTISDITLRNVDVRLKKAAFKTSGV